MMDIRTSLNYMGSEKATERKRGSDRIMNLLNNQSVVATLDHNSKLGESLNWDLVFDHARLYFLKEANKLEEDERKSRDVSQTVLSNRETHKRHIASFPKLVLRTSSLSFRSSQPTTSDTPLDKLRNASLHVRPF
ncbi:hypothetical protein SK128_028563 [Halocaridina rubra]|uniref:Uncharacterized protein n=1 Tax=Halocaridina rubra TaxID=373956 RepID=A0AAN9AEC8_HALRR